MLKPRQPLGPLPTCDQFDLFDERNPRVFEVIVELAREWVRRTGRRKIGVGMLYERARWELSIETDDPDYQLNNNWKPYYARKIMYECPDLDGMFDLRTSEADDWFARTYWLGSAA